MKATRSHVAKMPWGKYAAIVAATVIARPSLTHDEVREYIRTEHALHSKRVGQFLAITPIAEVVEWILQGIEG